MYRKFQPWFCLHIFVNFMEKLFTLIYGLFDIFLWTYEVMKYCLNIKIKLRLSISNIHTNEHKYANCGLHVNFLGRELMQISLNFQTCCHLKIRGLGAKLCVAFLLLLFWKKSWHFNSLCILLNQNIKL